MIAKRFFNTQNTDKVFSFNGKDFSERVAKYPKIVYQKELSSGHLCNSSGSLFPLGRKNIFSLRIDADDVDEAEFDKYLDILRSYSSLVTMFCCASAFSGKTHLLKKAKELNIDIESHGYYHHTYNDYANNLNNILKAKDFFEKLDIKTNGFAAPMGMYNKNLMLALEAVGYRYSSDFSFDYFNYPHYPRLGMRFSKVLQIPILPICPEILFANGLSVNEALLYYDKAIEAMVKSNIPIIIYAHTDIRYGQVKDLLSKILAKVSTNKDFYHCNMSEFAKYCFSLDDAHLFKQYGIISCEVARSVSVPPEDFLGKPAKKGIAKKIKSFMKDAVDFEKITPSQDLKGSRIKRALKLSLRKITANK